MGSLLFLTNPVPISVNLPNIMLSFIPSFWYLLTNMALTKDLMEPWKAMFENKVEPLEATLLMLCNILLKLTVLLSP